MDYHIAEQLFTKTQLQNSKKAFNVFDEDKDGKISTNFVGQLLRALGYNPTPTEVEDMIEDVGKPTLDYNIFLYIMARHARGATPEDDLVRAFRVFDKENTGFLSIDIVKHILMNIKQPFTSEQVDELLSKLKFKGQQVPYHNLVHLMLNY